MFTPVNQQEKPVHYPEDRRLFIWLKQLVFMIGGIELLAIVRGAWIQYLIYGLPPDNRSGGKRVSFMADPLPLGK